MLFWKGVCRHAAEEDACFLNIQNAICRKKCRCIADKTAAAWHDLLQSESIIWSIALDLNRLQGWHRLHAHCGSQAAVTVWFVQNGMLWSACLNRCIMSSVGQLLILMLLLHHGKRTVKAWFALWSKGRPYQFLLLQLCLLSFHLKYNSHRNRRRDFSKH